MVNSFLVDAPVIETNPVNKRNKKNNLCSFMENNFDDCIDQLKCNGRNNAKILFHKIMD